MAHGGAKYKRELASNVVQTVSEQEITIRGVFFLKIKHITFKAPICFLGIPLLFAVVYLVF